MKFSFGILPAIAQVTRNVNAAEKNFTAAARRDTRNRKAEAMV